MSQLINIAGMIIATIIGGSITYFVTNRQLAYQERREKQSRQLKHYEKLHKNLSVISNESFNVFNRFIGSKNGLPTQKNDIEILPWDETSMLIDFYVPQLKEMFKNLNDEHLPLGKAFSEIVTKSKDDPSIGRSIDEAKIALQKVRDIVGEIKADLSQLVQNYH